MPQLARIGDAVIRGRHVFSFALHLGFSYLFCQKHISYFLQEEGNRNSTCTHQFLAIAHMWLGGEEGTGELPRTRDTVMKALQKLELYANDFKVIREILLQE